MAALVAGLLLPATLTPAVAAAGDSSDAVRAAVRPVAQPASRAASLTVTPPIYVAGQAVRFRGNVGKAGRRTVHLQSHMNRPGDTWLDVPDSTFRTSADGSFDFIFTAPSMFGISYRVAGGGVATQGRLFNARPQEITLTLQGANAADPFHAVAPLLPFTVVADTTPDVRSALGTPPPIPGRTVLLQERTGGDRWRTIDRGTTDNAGHATFRVTPPLLGHRVLRARQERWTRDGSKIGWYASFPAYFSVLGLGKEQAAAPEPDTPPVTGSAPAGRRDPRARHGPQRGAADGGGALPVAHAAVRLRLGARPGPHLAAVEGHPPPRHLARHLRRHRPGDAVQRRAGAAEQAAAHR